MQLKQFDGRTIKYQQRKRALEEVEESDRVTSRTMSSRSNNVASLMRLTYK